MFKAVDRKIANILTGMQLPLTPLISISKMQLNTAKVIYAIKSVAIVSSSRSRMTRIAVGRFAIERIIQRLINTEK